MEQSVATRPDVPLLRRASSGSEGLEDLDDSILNEAPDSVMFSFSPFMQSPIDFFNDRFQAGSVKGSVVTLIVAVVGAGALSVPYAFQQSGVVLGCILFILGGYLAAFTLRLLIISSELTGAKSYEKMAKKLYGRNTANLVVATIMANLYGTTISYLVASGHIASLVFQVVLPNLYDDTELFHIQVFHPQFLTVFFVCVVVLPLSLLKSLSMLRYSSLLGVGCIVYITVVVVVKYFTMCTQQMEITMGDLQNHAVCFWNKTDLPNVTNPVTNDIKLYDFSFDHLFTAIPIVLFAYTCHPSLMAILLELKKPSQRRMGMVVNRATGFGVLVYVFLGAFAYLTFGNQLQYSSGNFLLNDYHQDYFVLVGAMGFAVSVTLAAPLLVSSFRTTVAAYVLYFFNYNAYIRFLTDKNQKTIGLAQRLRALEEEDSEVTEAKPKKKGLPTFWHNTVAIVFLTLAVIPAVAVKDISIVFSVLGATTNPMLCFLFPAMFIYKADTRNQYRGYKFASILLAIVMTVVSCISFVKKFK